MPSDKGYKLKGPTVKSIKDIQKSFEGDLFERDKLASKLNKYTERLGSGVIVIDAPWGEGKTWFARHWFKSIEEPKDRKAIYFDAFQNDYLEDPFLLITAEILKNISSDEKLKEKITDKASKVATTIIPVSAKLLINIIGRIALKQANLADDLKQSFQDIHEEISGFTEDFLKEKLQEYEQEHAAVSSFKAELTTFTQSQAKPVIILIDELDRCKPTFAVKLLERIKHFFDVPNLVFVLMINRDQMEKSIKGVYGSEIDASSYIHKFVDLNLRLPKRNDVDSIPYDFIEKYVSQMIGFYELAGSYEQHYAIIEMLKIFGAAFSLSFRDIEKIITLFCLNNSVQDLLYLKIWLAVLKIKKPNILEGIRENSAVSHREADAIISHMFERHPSIKSSREIILSIQSLHIWFQGGCKPEITENEDFKNRG